MQSVIPINVISEECLKISNFYKGKHPHVISHSSNANSLISKCKKGRTKYKVLSNIRAALSELLSIDNNTQFASIH